MTTRRWWILGGLLAALSAVAAGLALPDSAVEVETATVTRGSISVTVDQEGRTRVRDRYVVAAPVGGRLARLAIREGDRVSVDQLLARIYPSPQDRRTAEVARGQSAAAEARRLEVAAQVESARAQEEQAERDLARAEALIETGGITLNALEQTRLAATAARRQVEMRSAALRAAEAEVAAARAALIGANSSTLDGPDAAVRAPTAGRVLRVLQESARVVQAGTPLVEIGDATGLEAVVDVLSEDAVQIKPGAPVLIEQWGGATVLRGEVRFLEPEAFTKVSALGVEEQRVNVVVDLLDPPASLGAGYRLEARIVTWAGDNVLIVPTSAVFQQEGTWAVFVVENERAVHRTIEIGHRSSGAAEILKGLSEGDRVILYPSAAIADGVRVR